MRHPAAIALFAVAILTPEAAGARALPSFFRPEQIDASVSNGRSPSNNRGRALSFSFDVETTGSSPIAGRVLRGTQVGCSLGFGEIRQARIWRVQEGASPSDRVNVLASGLFLRRIRQRAWHSTHPFAELGSGPMWSNHAVPATTSRLNFKSWAAVGVTIRQTSPIPLRIGYSFSHISNAGLAERNPGWNLHSIFVGARLRKLQAR